MMHYIIMPYGHFEDGDQISSGRLITLLPRDIFMPVAMAYLVSTLGNALGPGINAFDNRIQLPAGAPQARVTSKHALYITLQNGSKLCLLKHNT